MTERTRCDLLQVPCKEGKTIAQIDADSRTHPLRLLPLCLSGSRVWFRISRRRQAFTPFIGGEVTREL